MGSPIVGNCLAPSVKFLDLRWWGAQLIGQSRGQGSQRQNSCTRDTVHRTLLLRAGRGLGKLRPGLAQGHTGELRDPRLFMLDPTSFHYTRVLMLLVLLDNQNNSFLCNTLTSSSQATPRDGYSCSHLTVRKTKTGELG